MRQFKSFVLNLACALNIFLSELFTALSFIAILLSFAFMVYYLFMSFDIMRVIASAVALFSFIYFNKSLRGWHSEKKTQDKKERRNYYVR